jgi:HK97 gp10 family phage protein
MAYTIKVEGVEALQKAFEEKRKEIEQATAETLNECADLVVESAKDKVLVLTGETQRAIDKSEVENKEGVMDIEVGIRNEPPFRKDGFKARFQEKGTSKQRAHPFLRPALIENKDAINEKMTGVLSKAVEK